MKEGEDKGRSKMSEEKDPWSNQQAVSGEEQELASFGVKGWE